MKFSVQHIPIKSLVSSDELTIKVFKFQSETPGPFIHLQANVHGAEVQGNMVLLHLLKYFKDHPFFGTIQIIPQANPMGINHKATTYTAGRFNPVTGQNWNRNYVDLMNLSYKQFDLNQFVQHSLGQDWKIIKNNFKMQLITIIDEYLEYLKPYGLSDDVFLNTQLQRLAAPADIVLDLHTAPVAVNYLYAPEYLKEKAYDLNFPVHLLIPHEFSGAMDEACFTPWVKLNLQFQKMQSECPLEFEAYTLELGSEEVISLHRAKETSLQLLHYLELRGVLPQGSVHLPSPLQVLNPLQRPLKNFKGYFAPIGGLCSYTKKAGQECQKGEELARIYSFDSITTVMDLEKDLFVPILANENCLVTNITPSANLTQGMTVAQVLEF